jgi:polysaccharide deacetylase family protein (PEP-CTERM system associated)
MTSLSREPFRNCLSVDFEDWYQLSEERLTTSGTSRGSILERQLDRLLGLLAERDTRATFFCLGKSLEKHPRLVRRVVEAGHETATHGWGHQLIREIGLEAFREDLYRSIGWLSDVTGRCVYGYRAPAFSLSPGQLQGFYDICFEAGLAYDSSVFPFRGRRYGIPDAAPGPQAVRSDGSRRLTEMPLATVAWLGRRWPVAGGGWWRVLPKWAIHAAIRRLNAEGHPFTSYVHVYEFDAEQLDGLQFGDGSSRARTWALKQNLGRSSMFGKLDRLLSTVRFGPIEDYLRHAGYL